MNNPWKIATLGILALAATSAASTMTTAYLIRPSVTEVTPADAVPPTLERRAPVVEVAPARLVSSGRTAAEVRAPDTVRVPVAERENESVPPASPVGAAPPDVGVPRAQVPVPQPGAPAPSPPQSSVPAPPAVASPGCDTGSDRAWRIAKPGLVGSVVGAGLGAAGGAIADGGKGAGKGALIGGLAGAALGGGYGAYQTKNECGTIFRDGTWSAR